MTALDSTNIYSANPGTPSYLATPGNEHYRPHRSRGYLHAGLLDGYIHWRQNLGDALHRGAAAASIVCSRQDVQPPTAAEVDRMLNATTTAAPRADSD